MKEQDILNILYSIDIEDIEIDPVDNDPEEVSAAAFDGLYALLDEDETVKEYADTHGMNKEDVIEEIMNHNEATVMIENAIADYEGMLTDNAYDRAHDI